MARYTLPLLLVVLMGCVPYHSIQSPIQGLLNSPEIDCFELELHSAASTFFAFGQNTTALKAQNMLPHCSLDPWEVCKGKSLPTLTLEHITKPYFYFPAQSKPLQYIATYVMWDSATFPLLQPNHTGVYQCKAGSLTSEKTYNLSVVVPSTIHCTQPEYLSECEVSVSCTVRAYPKPTVRWAGQPVINITNSTPSHGDGVISYNSTALFLLTSASSTKKSVSIKVFHDPAVKCTVVPDDSSILQLCKDTSRSITEHIPFPLWNGAAGKDHYVSPTPPVPTTTPVTPSIPTTTPVTPLVPTSSEVPTKKGIPTGGIVGIVLSGVLLLFIFIMCLLHPQRLCGVVTQILEQLGFHNGG